MIGEIVKTEKTEKGNTIVNVYCNFNGGAGEKEVKPVPKDEDYKYIVYLLDQKGKYRAAENINPAFFMMDTPSVYNETDGPIKGVAFYTNDPKLKGFRIAKNIRNTDGMRPNIMGILEEELQLGPDGTYEFPKTSPTFIELSNFEGNQSFYLVGPIYTKKIKDPFIGEKRICIINSIEKSPQ